MSQGIQFTQAVGDADEWTLKTASELERGEEIFHARQWVTVVGTNQARVIYHRPGDDEDSWVVSSPDQMYLTRKAEKPVSKAWSAAYRALEWRLLPVGLVAEEIDAFADEVVEAIKSTAMSSLVEHYGGTEDTRNGIIDAIFGPQAKPAVDPGICPCGAKPGDAHDQRWHNRSAS